MSQIHFLPVLVASIVAFAIGAAWYSPLLFGKEWMKLKGMSEKEVSSADKSGMWRYYAAQLVSTVVLFAVMGFLIASAGSRSVSDGAFFGFIAWVGFSLTTAVGDMLWNKTPFKLALINEVCTLVSWVIGGAIIGGWS